MDVELQILKHLKPDAQSTVAIIDQYCDSYLWGRQASYKADWIRETAFIPLR